MVRLKGYTLVELIVATIILTIVSTMSILVYLQVANRMINPSELRLRRTAHYVADSITNGQYGVNHEVSYMVHGLQVQYTKREMEEWLWEVQVVVRDTARNHAYDYQILNYEP